MGSMMDEEIQAMKQRSERYGHLTFDELFELLDKQNDEINAAQTVELKFLREFEKSRAKGDGEAMNKIQQALAVLRAAYPELDGVTD